MNKVEEQLTGRLRPYYCFEAAFAGISFIIPTLALHWQACGLDLSQIMQLEAIFAVVLAICEVPTGYVADRLGRKSSLLVASVLVTCSMIIYAFGSGFGDFLVGECLLAVAIAFLSGANDAFVADTLQEFGRETAYMDIKGRALAVHMSCSSIGAIFGGLLAAHVSYRATFVPAVIITAGMIPAALMLTEPARQKLETGHNYFREVFAIGRFALWRNARLRWLILATAVTLGSTQAAFWFYQPYFKLCETPEYLFGWIYAGFNLFCAGMTSRTGKWLRNTAPGTGLVLFMLLTGTGYLVLSQTMLPWGFLFLMLHQSVRGLAQPFFGFYVNREVEGSIRATVGSISSMVRLLLYGAVIVPLGAYAEAESVPAAFAVAAGLFTVLSLILLWRMPVAFGARAEQPMRQV